MGVPYEVGPFADHTVHLTVAAAADLFENLPLQILSSKSNIDDFERERFIHSVRDGQVRFHYRGAWREPSLKRGVTPSDVRWISERLARLTAEQWSDAFRAAGYSEPDARRYVIRLRQKVSEGLALEDGS